MGIPVVGAVIALGVLAFLLWDAVRVPGEPWFRWMSPGGYCLMLFAITQYWVPVIAFSALLMGVGMGLSNYWRWRGRHRSRGQWHRKIPPYRPR
ncbi:hypothetical protein EQK42_23980 [Streptomyces albidoflavus]|nr:hypothetical protein EQK42_23980 [Streptomyces albidoflavus]